MILLLNKVHHVDLVGGFEVDENVVHAKVPWVVVFYSGVWGIFE
jgi:hypothetical protein